MNNSIMQCCICNNEKTGEFITINDNKYHLNCIEQLQQENKLLKELKAKIIDGDDDIELTYDLGDYLCSIDCCLGQNHEICELKKKIKKLKQDYKCVKTQRDGISKNATETIEKCIEEIRELKSQLQQRDEVIKKAIKRTSEIKELGFDRIAKIEILDILNEYKKEGMNNDINNN